MLGMLSHLAATGKMPFFTIFKESGNQFIVLWFYVCVRVCMYILLQMALQPGVGLGLLYNMPPGLSVPSSVSPFVYTHLSQVHGHIIQPSHSWSSSSSRCVQLSVHLFWDFGVLHSFCMAKPLNFLAFNKPDNVLSLDYGF